MENFMGSFLDTFFFHMKGLRYTVADKQPCLRYGPTTMDHCGKYHSPENTEILERRSPGKLILLKLFYRFFQISPFFLLILL